MHFPSKFIEEAVQEFEKLPGIGIKTAVRLVLHLLNEESSVTGQFSDTLRRMRDSVKFCKICFNVSDDEICSICSNPKRNQQVICVVENIRDVLAIENTNSFQGVYHILGGVISPLEGIGPDDLHIETLIHRAGESDVTEIIMALNPTVEGDTTIFYLSKKLEPHNVRITSIARGVSFGGDLEYVDEMTLGRSISTRQPYENYIIQKQ